MRYTLISHYLILWHEFACLWKYSNSSIQWVPIHIGIQGPWRYYPNLPCPSFLQGVSEKNETTGSLGNLSKMNVETIFGWQPEPEFRWKPCVPRVPQELLSKQQTRSRHIPAFNRLNFPWELKFPWELSDKSFNICNTLDILLDLNTWE